MDGDQQPGNTDGSWQYRPNEAADREPTFAPVPYGTAVDAELVQPRSVASPPIGPDGGITWTASEFIAHQKSSGWYGYLAGGAAVLTLIVWFLTRDFISSAVVVAAAAAFGFYAARKPRDVSYSLDGDGLTIANRSFPYQQFRSFSIIREGAFSSIAFVPLKRFAPLVSIYYDPADEQKIVDLLNSQLPLEHRQPDLIDQLMWRMRF